MIATMKFDRLTIVGLTLKAESDLENAVMQNWPNDIRLNVQKHEGIIDLTFYKETKAPAPFKCVEPPANSIPEVGEAVRVVPGVSAEFTYEGVVCGVHNLECGIRLSVRRTADKWLMENIPLEWVHRLRPLGAL